jgi:NAD-dependent DNA ligase|tara:strand:+ start:216 stop:590 length:375 start_codon:yes stop_codon:yes gene_type:complete
MAGERVTKILLAKSDLTVDEIAAMSDREAWRWLYSHFPPKTHRHKKNAQQICFTGFSISERKQLENEAEEAHLEIVKSVTKSLRYLVTGPNAGPIKLEKARQQEVVIMNINQFHNMLETGELPL